MSDPVRIVVGSGESAEIRIPESALIVGPPGPAGEDGATFFPEVSEEGVISWTNDGGYDNPEPVNIKGPAGNDGSDGEDGADGVSPTVTFSTITGGHTMTVTDKDHPSGQSINIMDGESGGGGTSDYDDLTNKPSINNVTLSGNKTAAQLGLAAASDIPTVPVQSVNGKTGAVVLSASDVGAGTYSKPSGGIPASDLASAVLSPYRKAAAQDAVDAAQDAEIGIVITGRRPSVAVTVGQYVIVRNSTISGISDGLYTANVTLSPSTDVSAANLETVSNGGLNDLQSYFAPYDAGYTDFNSNAFQFESWGRIYVYVSGHVCIIGISGVKPISTLSGNTTLCKLPFVSKSAVMAVLTNGGKAFIQVNNNTIYIPSGVAGGTELNGQLAILI